MHNNCDIFIIIINLSIKVYKSYPFHPSNGTFDPRLSFNQQDVDFLVENGFSIVRLYVAWQGVEFSKERYNSTYLHVRYLRLLVASVYTPASWYDLDSSLSYGSE